MAVCYPFCSVRVLCQCGMAQQLTLGAFISRQHLRAALPLAAGAAPSQVALTPAASVLGRLRLPRARSDKERAN